MGNGDLKKIKENYLMTYDNCIIFNYFDLKHHKNIIKDKINKLCFQNQKKINARECKLLHIENSVKNDFLNKYHIQGTDKSQIFYGAYHGEELIAVITFDNKKPMNGGIQDNIYDLSRFSVKLGYIVVGIFNKMLKKFINDYSPQKIISYADLNIVNKDNNIYFHNNFKLSKIIPPDYKIYLKNKNEIYHKFTFGNKFFNNQNVSAENKKIIKENSKKIWNCGKLKYELFINENNNIVFGFIYMIKNVINNKVYIGQTTRNLNKRIWEYKSAFNRNIFYNQYLLNSFNKYGWNNFEFSIIDTAGSIQELNAKEIQYILNYKSNDKEFGYNIESGGKNAIPDMETLDKMSKSHLGIVQSDEWVDRRIAKAGSEDAKKYGKTKTEEEKLNLSIKSPKYWQGRNRDEKTKLKISKTKKENGLSEKQKEIICKKVYLVDLNVNEIIEMFESTAQAANVKKVNQSTISRWCSKNKIIDNILWRY
jgi:group I intron endonuclease